MPINERELYDAGEKFVTWLEKRIVGCSRGDQDQSITVKPDGKYWLGRIAPEKMVMESLLGERGGRMDPCAIGIRFQPKGGGPWKFKARVKASVWLKIDKDQWEKQEAINEEFEVIVQDSSEHQSFGGERISKALKAVVKEDGMSAQVQVEVNKRPNETPELIVLLTNTSLAESKKISDTRLYETSLGIEGIDNKPYQIAALEDSFRYDRSVAAYGINCGVLENPNGSLETVDVPRSDKFRPIFWSQTTPSPNFSFKSLSVDPLPELQNLHKQLVEWGGDNWSKEHLAGRAKNERWSPEMEKRAADESALFFEECSRIKSGLELLEKDSNLLRSFKFMNRAMAISAAGKYSSWRPFQVGFLLANLPSITDLSKESDVVDIVWFATGGGKTETYLGYLITHAFYDRFRGKKSGITAWSRFPLRMLSLQQTQRFANALCAAEMVRQEEKIDGDVFSLGFFVGSGATPNSLKEGDAVWDPDDEKMPDRVRVLDQCPFCRSTGIKTFVDRRTWRLVHQCIGNDCFWQKKPLPIYVVDDEIYRFLPTVVVGTLDKAASISLQASMRGFVAAPAAMCSKAGHGYTYSKRSTKPNGCLVPGCKGDLLPLEMDKKLFSPTVRLQDELHLLRDSLGAVDAAYESLYDGIIQELSGFKPKILASSATLAGYKKQSSVLYSRTARVFPQAAPAPGGGFWTADSQDLMRRYLALSPRGVTLEFAVDRLLAELQKAIRFLVNSPAEAAKVIGVAVELIPELVNLYGTNVVYGNTLKDLDAVMRSTETQLGDVEGQVNVVQLTGKTDFSEVRNTLDRLNSPEGKFEERVHIIPASSMMSHGVDVDRLNIMVMLGHPLGASEFIQATARVGRKWPGIVLVLHKIARERDASIYRSFDKFVSHCDRFVEPIPVTRKSRRVLAKVLAGIEFARVQMIFEPEGGVPLTTIPKLREYINKRGNFIREELATLSKYLGLDVEYDENMIKDIETWLTYFLRNLRDPPTNAKWPTELSHTGTPMRSLRDVEEQIPVAGSTFK